MMDYRSLIRSVPDFPKPGINFKDITTLIQRGDALQGVTRDLISAFSNKKFDLVAGIESRGFIFGAAMAAQMGVGFIPVRKPGKLPAATIAVSYALEYGENVLHMHEDSVSAGQQVLIVDDLLATGGTVLATCELLEKLGATVAGIGVVIELSFLNARKKLQRYNVRSLVTYDEE